MRTRALLTFAGLVVTLSIGACSREGIGSSDTASSGSGDTGAARTAELQRERDEDVERFAEQVRNIEREYGEAREEVTTGAKSATTGLREELREDVSNVKQAVADLRSTTPQNWWDRHEQAVRRTADDIQEDVGRLAGKLPAQRPETATTGEGVSTAPFDSRRDRLVADLRARVDTMKRALDGVEADGARQTEVEDARARLNKLADDLDALASASADDWWTISRTRVSEYLDRVQRSVDRLDDDKP